MFLFSLMVNPSLIVLFIQSKGPAQNATRNWINFLWEMQSFPRRNVMFCQSHAELFQMVMLSDEIQSEYFIEINM